MLGVRVSALNLEHARVQICDGGLLRLGFLDAGIYSSGARSARSALRNSVIADMQSMQFFPCAFLPNPVDS